MSTSTPVPTRIGVIGSTGSGKTTLARELASRIGLRHVELDALFWEPNWTPVPAEVFGERMDAALRGDYWVSDGNYFGYQSIRDIVLTRAETMLWLDYSFPVIMRRLLWRTFRRSLRREELWSGNRESLLRAFSRDSILLWLLCSYWRQRREFVAQLEQPAYAHLHVQRLRTPAMTRAWLALT